MSHAPRLRSACTTRSFISSLSLLVSLLVALRSFIVHVYDNALLVSGRGQAEALLVIHLFALKYFCGTLPSRRPLKPKYDTENTEVFAVVFAT